MPSNKPSLGNPEQGIIQDLDRRNLGQQVTDLLRQMVVVGDFRPGERLVELRLADRLGISRTPVREALHRLAQEEILTKRQRGGYVVRPLTAAEVEDAVGLRSVLEGYAAERAARLATPEVLEAMARNLESFREALEEQDEKTLVALNSEFHILLDQAANSNLLSRQLRELSRIVERISRALMSNMTAGNWSCKDHKELFDAIAAGDAAGASRLAREHVEHGGRYILSRMKDEGLEL